MPPPPGAMYGREPSPWSAAVRGVFDRLDRTNGIGGVPRDALVREVRTPEVRGVLATAAERAGAAAPGEGALAVERLLNRVTFSSSGGTITWGELAGLSESVLGSPPPPLGRAASRAVDKGDTIALGSITMHTDGLTQEQLASLRGFADETKELSEDKQNLNDAVQRLQRESQDKTHIIVDRDATIAQLRGGEQADVSKWKEKNTRNIGDLERRVGDLTVEAEGKDKQLAHARTREAELSQRASLLALQVEELENAAKRTGDDNKLAASRTSQELAEAARRHEELRRQMAEQQQSLLREEQQRRRAESDLRDSRQQCEQLQRETARAQDDLRAYRASLTAEMERQQEALEAAHREAREAISSLRDERSKNTKMKLDLHEKETTLEQRELEIKRLRDELEQVKAELAAARKVEGILRIDIKELQMVKEQREGDLAKTRQGMKNAAENWDQERQQMDSLADLMQQHTDLLQRTNDDILEMLPGATPRSANGRPGSARRAPSCRHDGVAVLPEEVGRVVDIRDKLAETLAAQDQRRDDTQRRHDAESAEWARRHGAEKRRAALLDALLYLQGREAEDRAALMNERDSHHLHLHGQARRADRGRQRSAAAVDADEASRRQDMLVNLSRELVDASRAWARVGRDGAAAEARGAAAARGLLAAVAEEERRRAIIAGDEAAERASIRAAAERVVVTQLRAERKHSDLRRQRSELGRQGRAEAQARVEAEEAAGRAGVRHAEQAARREMEGVLHRGAAALADERARRAAEQAAADAREEARRARAAAADDERARRAAVEAEERDARRLLDQCVGAVRSANAAARRAEAAVRERDDAEARRNVGADEQRARDGVAAEERGVRATMDALRALRGVERAETFARADVEEYGDADFQLLALAFEDGLRDVQEREQATALKRQASMAARAEAARRMKENARKGHAYLGLEVSEGIKVGGNKLNKDGTLGTLDGVVVHDVAPEGPAWDAGLQTDDLITMFNGVAIQKLPDFRACAGRLKPGDDVVLGIYRAGREPYEEIEVRTALVGEESGFEPGRARTIGYTVPVLAVRDRYSSILEERGARERKREQQRRKLEQQYNYHTDRFDSFAGSGGTSLYDTSFGADDASSAPPARPLYGDDGTLRRPSLPPSASPVASGRPQYGRTSEYQSPTSHYRDAGYSRGSVSPGRSRMGDPRDARGGGYGTTQSLSRLGDDLGGTRGAPLASGRSAGRTGGRSPGRERNSSIPGPGMYDYGGGSSYGGSRTALAPRTTAAPTVTGVSAGARQPGESAARARLRHMREEEARKNAGLRASSQDI